MILVQATVVLGRASTCRVLIPIVKGYVSWVYHPLLEIVRAYLVRATSLPVQVRAVVAVRLTLMVHVYVDAHFVASAVLRRVALLRRLRRLRV